MQTNNLIKLYFHVCDKYKEQIRWEVQRFSNNNKPQGNADGLKVVLGDSFPVITCSHKRAGKVARELTDKGYCATKKLHYYGVKIHTLGLSRPSTIPFPSTLTLRQQVCTT